MKLPAKISHNVKTIIELYPRIGNRIVLLWGTPELQNYLNSLIDDKEKPEGFPQHIATAILLIQEEHGKLILESHDKSANKRIVRNQAGIL